MTWKFLAAAVLLVALCSCQQNSEYRKSGVEAFCGRGANDKIIADPNCKDVQVEDLATRRQGTVFSINYVELSDQGEFHDRDQMRTVFKNIARDAEPDGALIVVFVHGWLHNASFDDPNVVGFRHLLYRIQGLESDKAVIRARDHDEMHANWPMPTIVNAQTPDSDGTTQPIRPRKVIGVYVGWRGAAITQGSLLEYLTFWNRKSAAERVAEGSVRELLAGVKKLQDEINLKHDDMHRKHAIDAHAKWTGAGPAPPYLDISHSTRLIIIGHSFGGLIVYEALSQGFIENATAPLLSGTTGSGACRDTDRDIRSYGDIVFLINPAFEATRYDPIHRATADRKECFKQYQSPVLVTITSETDWATNYAFPAGRFIPAIDEDFRSREEHQQSVNTVGHIDWMATHHIVAPQKPQYVWVTSTILTQECLNFRAFDQTERPKGRFGKSWKRVYADGTVLEQLPTSRLDPNAPFWVVSADKSVIDGHSDFSKPALFDFIRQVISDYDREITQYEKLKAHRPGPFVCPAALATPDAPKTTQSGAAVPEPASTE